MALRTTFRHESSRSLNQNAVILSKAKDLRFLGFPTYPLGEVSTSDITPPNLPFIAVSSFQLPDRGL